MRALPAGKQALQAETVLGRMHSRAHSAGRWQLAAT